MNKEILQRKGARKLKDIPPAVLQLLNEGKIETVNLTEWLAIDHSSLIKKVFPTLGITAETVTLLEQALAAQKKPTTMNAVKLIGSLLHENISSKTKLAKVFKQLSAHPADSIRCYAPYLISLRSDLGIKEKLEGIKGLVADQHFGVREVVWMAIRPALEQQLPEAITTLSAWTAAEDENIRRFTTEATRPRGVWCKHIDALKEQPELALPILEPLKADTSKYVQDSVGNWLNDASKSQPDFVINLCEKWKKASPSKATEKIIKRARRTLDKKK